jgi:hypothetical protein
MSAGPPANPIPAAPDVALRYFAGKGLELTIDIHIAYNTFIHDAKFGYIRLLYPPSD